MRRNVQRNRKDDLYRAILKLETVEECENFFRDICAETELRSLEQRYEVAGMLSLNKVYSDIVTKTGASTATISRVNRVLNGGTGMLETILERMQDSSMSESEEGKEI